MGCRACFGMLGIGGRCAAESVPGTPRPRGSGGATEWIRFRSHLTPEWRDQAKLIDTAPSRLPQSMKRYLATAPGPSGIAASTGAPATIATDFGGVTAALQRQGCRWINARHIEVSGGTSRRTAARRAQHVVSRPARAGSPHVAHRPRREYFPNLSRRRDRL